MILAMALSIALLPGMIAGPAHAQEAPSFSDVPDGHRFEQEIAWPASTVITQRRGDGTFGVNDPVTRGQMAAFLYRHAVSPPLDVDLPEPTQEPSSPLEPGSYMGMALELDLDEWVLHVDIVEVLMQADAVAWWAERPEYLAQHRLRR